MGAHKTRHFTEISGGGKTKHWLGGVKPTSAPSNLLKLRKLRITKPNDKIYVASLWTTRPEIFSMCSAGGRKTCHFTEISSSRKTKHWLGGVKSTLPGPWGDPNLHSSGPMEAIYYNYDKLKVIGGYIMTGVDLNFILQIVHFMYKGMNITLTWNQNIYDNLWYPLSGKLRYFSGNLLF